MAWYRSLGSIWHLGSLDAPTVAVAWCCAFAHVAGVPLPWPVPLTLGLATWIAYVGDRLLDARFARDPGKLRDRHRLYGTLWRERTKLTVLALFAAALGCVVLGFVELPRALLVGYAALSVVSVGYFGVVHAVGPEAERWLPKEAAVGAIFAIGSALPAWVGASRAARVDLTPTVGLFAILCWLNCVAIERWEAATGALTTGHRSTRWAADALARLLLMSGVMSLAIIAWRGRPEAILGAPLALAFLLLLALERGQRVLSARTSRVLADAALLTPIPLMVFWLLRP